MKKSSNKIAFMGLFCALALIFSYIEVLLPPIYPSLPGIKMGLANIIIVFLIYRLGFKYAVLVSLLRIIIINMLFGNSMALLYSLAGGILSLLVMAILKKLNLLSVIGVSISGGVMHNVGQILMAILLLDTTELGYYMVILTITGIISGIFVGLCGFILIKKIPLKLTRFN